jgi:hypothetical protein
MAKVCPKVGTIVRAERNPYFSLSATMSILDPFGGLSLLEVMGDHRRARVWAVDTVTGDPAAETLPLEGLPKGL